MTATADIPEGSVWIYTGHGRGVGLLHVVTSNEDDTITTWGQPERSFVGTSVGYSWLGSVKDFRSVFARSR